MKRLNKKGFSLVELLAAIAILAILMTVATQAYNIYKKQARQQAYDTMAKSATTAATNYLMENTKAKYITFETLKEKQYVDTLQDPRYKDKECSGIVINKVIQGETQKKLDVLFQKVKLCCKNYKYQYDYTGNEVKVTEIESCEYVEGDEIDGVYKLIYKTQGGTDCDPGVVMKRQREKWGPLCETKRDKYVFKGWNTKKKGTGAYITADTVVGDSDINAYAIWNAIYTLTYDEDGGTPCNPKSFDKENGEKWGPLCETSKDGYAFKGWTTKKGGEGSKITKNTYAEKNITAYAHWNPYYTITFDSNGGTTCDPNTITKEKGEEWGALCTPTRSGYAFKGWNTKKDGTGEKITNTSIVEKTMTVYAIWNPKYTLTFNPDGGNECNPKTITEEKGKTWGTLCTTKKTGYSFGGWYNGTEKVTDATKVESSITAKAQWIPKKYTLTYNNNEGTGCTTKNADYNSPWGDLCKPTRTGYTFTGWTKDGAAVTKDTICKGNITAIANWSINSYKLSYSDDGNVKSCVSESISKNYNIAWGTLCKPQKTGHTFTGWYKGSTEIKSTTKATANITVTAQWSTNKYTLTYDDNTGSGCSSSSVNKSYGSKWGTLCKPSKTGHTFTGWNTAKAGNGTYVTENSIVSGNVKVYAQWTANACTLTYNNNNGSGCSGTVSSSYGNTWSIGCSSTREHYDFKGWNTKADGSGITVSSSTSTTTVCDSTIYAQWKKKNYTLSYSGTGSSSCSPITKAYNTAWGTLCSPQPQTGYTFIGWMNGSTQITDTSKATANITVTPKWNANQYTLTYNNDGGSGCTNKKAYYGSAWGTLCTPTKSGYDFAGWYNASGNQVTSSTVCSGNTSATARWTKNSVQTKVSLTKTGTSSSMTLTLAAYNPDTSMPVTGTATKGTVSSCYFSGKNIICSVTGIPKITATSTEHCKKLASANNVTTGEIVYIGVSDSYNSKDYYDNASDGVGCYIKVAEGPKFTSSQNWSCKRASTTFFKGSSDHCPSSYCGYDDCLTYGYRRDGSKYYCQCFRKVASNIKTYYETTVTATYYTKG